VDVAKTTVLNTATQRVDGKRMAYRVDMRQTLDGTPSSARLTWLTIHYRSGDVSVHVTVFGDDAADEALIDRIVDGVHLN
jgi:hypothetical protein